MAQRSTYDELNEWIIVKFRENKLFLEPAQESII